ncbi:MAG TPA: ketol-acid reductoisomerase, partial [Thermoanaerobaculia bacterium]|nr:ketol-acid reductoisomerase [Thermoanaerobaculia bacterium]
VRRLVLLLALALVSCRTADPALRKAFITPADVEVAIAAEKSLAPNYEVLPGEGEAWFETLPGSGRVLIVAGHATAQTREGAMKVPDRGTGGLAVALNKLTGSPAIVTTRRSPSDPNYYDDNAFKEAVARLVDERRPVLVLDLHASHSLRPYDVDFGVMDGRSLLGREEWVTLLARLLREEGLMNLSRDYFPAAKNQTVTKFVSARGTPSIQVEISATLLDPGRDPLYGHRFAQLLQALTRFIQTIGK